MLSIAEKVEFFKGTYLFENAPASDMARIAEVAQELHFSDNQTVFNEGDRGDAVYFVVSGQVKAHRGDVEVVRLGQSRCFGEIAVMDDSSRSTSISSIGDIVLLKINRGDFHHAVRDNVELMQNVLRIVLEKLRADITREVEAARERERIMQDMLRAREMQMSMLPMQDLRVEIANGLSLVASGKCNPAEMVGGDYHDYFQLPDDQVGLVIGDVTGHGFHTGLMVAMASSCLHTQIRADYSLTSVMSAMSDMVYGAVQSDLYSDLVSPLYMTFCYIIVDLRNQTVSFSNAGHNYPYHYRASTKQLNSLESNACTLGILEYQDYEVNQLKWEAGDILVFYSDGIVEAQNKEQEDFGEERLKQLVMENSDLPPTQMREAILQEVYDFGQDVTQADDITLMIVRMD